MIRSSVILVVVLNILRSALCQDVALVTKPKQSEVKFAIGKNYFVECLGKDVPDAQTALMKDLKWIKNGENIDFPNCNSKSEETVKACVTVSPGSISLLLKSVDENDSGVYTCKASFAGNRELEVSQTLIVIQEITWVNCQESQHVVLKESEGRIECLVTANPPATIEWRVGDPNKNFIKNNKKFEIDGDGLTIKNVSLEDAGKYFIRARVASEGLFEDKEIIVNVLVAPKITGPPENVIAVQGEEAKMRCSADGDPKPKIIWLNKERSDLQTLPDYIVDQTTGELTIKSVKKEHEGSYICQANNIVDSREAEAKLSVVVKPHIEKFENITVDENMKAVLKCESSGDPAPKITIQKVGDKIPENTGRVTLSPGKSDIEGWTATLLTISTVSRSDDGLYSCVSKNEGGGMVEKKGHITVQHTPLMYETPSTEVITWQGNPVNITCVARSIPNATIEWQFEGEALITDSRGFKIFGSGPYSLLNIEKPTSQNYGLYVCKAKNTIGENQTTIRLKEVFKPGRLMQAKVKATATTLSVRIVPPNADGGAVITSYISEYKAVSSKEWKIKTWPAISDSNILEGLIPNTEYDFRFAAQNAVGTGEFVETQRMRTLSEAPPEPPSFLTNNPTGVSYSPYANRFEVKWSVPQDNGATITSYSINFFQVKNDSSVWIKNSDFKQQTLKPSNTSFVLQQLSPETYYKVEVRAHNRLGSSTSSDIIFRTAKDSGLGIQKELSSIDRKSEDKSLKTAEVVGIIIGILVIVLIIIVDVSCCATRKCGVTFFVCAKLKGDGKSDEKSKEFLDDGKLSEKEPLRNGDKALETADAKPAMIKGDKAKENEAMDVNSVDSDIKSPKDSAV